MHIQRSQFWTFMELNSRCDKLWWKGHWGHHGRRIKKTYLTSGNDAFLPFKAYLFIITILYSSRVLYVQCSGSVEWLQGSRERNDFPGSTVVFFLCLPFGRRSRQSYYSFFRSEITIVVMAIWTWSLPGMHFPHFFFFGFDCLSRKWPRLTKNIFSQEMYKTCALTSKNVCSFPRRTMALIPTEHAVILLCDWAGVYLVQSGNPQLIRSLWLGSYYSGRLYVQ